MEYFIFFSTFLTICNSFVENLLESSLCRLGCLWLLFSGRQRSGHTQNRSSKNKKNTLVFFLKHPEYIGGINLHLYLPFPCLCHAVGPTSPSAFYLNTINPHRSAVESDSILPFISLGSALFIYCIVFYFILVFFLQLIEHKSQNRCLFGNKYKIRENLWTKKRKKERKNVSFFTFVFPQPTDQSNAHYFLTSW